MEKETDAKTTSVEIRRLRRHKYSLITRFTKWFIGDYWRPVKLGVHNIDDAGTHEITETFAVVNQFRGLAFGGDTIKSGQQAAFMAAGMNRMYATKEES